VVFIFLVSREGAKGAKGEDWMKSGFGFWFFFALFVLFVVKNGLSGLMVFEEWVF